MESLRAQLELSQQVASTGLQSCSEGLQSCNEGLQSCNEHIDAVEDRVEQVQVGGGGRTGLGPLLVASCAAALRARQRPPLQMPQGPARCACSFSPALAPTVKLLPQPSPAAAGNGVCHQRARPVPHHLLCRPQGALRSI